MSPENCWVLLSGTAPKYLVTVPLHNDETFNLESRVIFYRTICLPYVFHIVPYVYHMSPVNMWILQPRQVTTSSCSAGHFVLELQMTNVRSTVSTASTGHTGPGFVNGAYRSTVPTLPPRGDVPTQVPTTFVSDWAADWAPMSM